MTSIRLYRVPGRGVFINSYHPGLQIFAVRTNGPGIPCGAVPRGTGRRYSAMSPAFASGVSASYCSMSGAISPPGILWPKDGTKKYLRMMKISAMATTLTRFCTASS